MIIFPSLIILKSLRFLFSSIFSPQFSSLLLPFFLSSPHFSINFPFLFSLLFSCSPAHLSFLSLFFLTFLFSPFSLLFSPFILSLLFSFHFSSLHSFSLFLSPFISLLLSPLSVLPTFHSLLLNFYSLSPSQLLFPLSFSHSIFSPSSLGISYLYNATQHYR